MTKIEYGPHPCKVCKREVDPATELQIVAYDGKGKGPFVYCKEHAPLAFNRPRKPLTLKEEDKRHVEATWDALARHNTIDREI